MSTITTINALPRDPRIAIFTKLEPKELAIAARVCKLWRDETSHELIWRPLLTKDFPTATVISPSSKAQYKQEMQLQPIRDKYPTDLIEALGGAEKVFNLPVLDLGNREGFTDYIDFLRSKELTAPIMRGTDKKGRPFIALKLKDKHTDRVAVVCLFQRRADANKNCWAAGVGTIAYNALSFSTAESVESYAEKVDMLLKGTHTDYSLVE